MEQFVMKTAPDMLKLTYELLEGTLKAMQVRMINDAGDGLGYSTFTVGDFVTNENHKTIMYLLSGLGYDVTLGDDLETLRVTWG